MGDVERSAFTGKEHVFELGLVLAGAVSGGAYTAGVIDFLVEALDAWYAAKAAGDKTVPRHDTRLGIVAGASAGSVVGALLAAHGSHAFPHVNVAADATAMAANPFYRTWVKELDILKFLDKSDLDKAGRLRSLLNCDGLDRIADEVISMRFDAAPQASRAWLHDPFRLCLTVTNLHGVPVNVSFTGAGGLGHEMVMHGDYKAFCAPVYSDPQSSPFGADHTVLTKPNNTRTAIWQELAEAAKASGAFPLALKRRRLSAKADDYRDRYPFNAGKGAGTLSTPLQGAYDYLAVDGGTINNEPFDIVRRHLGIGEDPAGEKADAVRGAIVMVDPFSDPEFRAPNPDPSLLGLTGQIIAAMKQQCRFKPEEYRQMMQDSVYSRFLVAPSSERGGKDVRGKDALCSAGLGAFVGFFSEDFRSHDYFLGRKNCCSFLRNWFVLPKGHPLFAHPDNGAEIVWEKYASTTRLDTPHYQIIPLVKPFAEDRKEPAWPVSRPREWQKVEAGVRTRLDCVFKELLTDVTPTGLMGMLLRLVCRAFWSLGGLSKAHEACMKAINDSVNATLAPAKPSAALNISSSRSA